MWTESNPSCCPRPTGGGGVNRTPPGVFLIAERRWRAAPLFLATCSDKLSAHSVKNLTAVHLHSGHVLVNPSIQKVRTKFIKKGQVSIHPTSNKLCNDVTVTVRIRRPTSFSSATHDGASCRRASPPGGCPVRERWTTFDTEVAIISEIAGGRSGYCLLMLLLTR